MSGNETNVGGKKPWIPNELYSVLCMQKVGGIEATMRMKFPHSFAEIMWGDVTLPTTHRVGLKNIHLCTIGHW